MTWIKNTPTPLLLITTFSVATTLALCSVSPDIQPDTASYLRFSPERGILYPLLLDLFRLTTPPDSTLAWVARFQGACIAAAAAFFAFRVGRLLSLGKTWYHLLYLLIALPGVAFAGNILTEPLTYAGVILFWVLNLQYYLAPGIWRALCLALLSALLVIHRPHMLPLVAFSGLVQLWGFARHRRLIHAKALVLLVLSLVAANTTQNHVRVMLTGDPHIASTVGSHILANMIYVAHPEDSALFSDEGQRRVFQKAIRLADVKGYTRQKWDKTASHIPTSIHRLFYEAVLPLCNEEILLNGNGGDSADLLALKMGLTLLGKRWPEYLSLLLRKTYDSQPFFYALTVVLMALGLAHAKRTGAWQGRFLAIVVIGTALSVLPYLLLITLDKRFVFPVEYPILIWVTALGASLLGQTRTRLDK
ncbi:MAG: hypothetical protein CVU73_06700 [Deltaproteobacteria bacterium HGW-Deltaproteobacteria-8]|nr:MAG: hypothetical protein CVU73_06700 [Deltaproteobacteria bacterium HGW-Deltaproteobacteria-8]